VEILAAAPGVIAWMQDACRASFGMMDCDAVAALAGLFERSACRRSLVSHTEILSHLAFVGATQRRLKRVLQERP